MQPDVRLRSFTYGKFIDRAYVTSSIPCVMKYMPYGALSKAIPLLSQSRKKTVLGNGGALVTWGCALLGRPWRPRHLCDTYPRHGVHSEILSPRLRLPDERVRLTNWSEPTPSASVFGPVAVRRHRVTAFSGASHSHFSLSHCSSHASHCLRLCPHSPYILFLLEQSG